MLDKLSICPKELSEFVLWLCQRGFDFESSFNDELSERSFEFGVLDEEDHYWLKVWFKNGIFDRVLVQHDEAGFYKTTLG